MIENRCIEPCNAPLAWEIDNGPGLPEPTAKLLCTEMSHTLLVIPVECIKAALNGDLRFILGPREGSS